MDEQKLDGKGRSWRSPMKQRTYRVQVGVEAASTLLDLKGLKHRAFSLNISNDTDLLMKVTLYLDNFRCCTGLLNIQPKSTSPQFLFFCPDSTLLDMQIEHNYFPTDQPSKNTKIVVMSPRVSSLFQAKCALHVCVFLFCFVRMFLIPYSFLSQSSVLDVF